VLPWSTYTRTKLETADRAKEDLQLTVTSSTRRHVDSVRAGNANRSDHRSSIRVEGGHSKPGRPIAAHIEVTFQRNAGSRNRTLVE